MKKETTLEKLENAFLRLKEGKPIRTKANRKITPSSVEDEAGLPKSTLRNTEAYRSLFNEIVDYKHSAIKNSQIERSVKGKPSSNNKEMINLKKTIRELRDKVNDKQQTIDFLVAANAELTELLSEKVTNNRLNEFLRSQETVVQISNVERGG